MDLITTLRYAAHGGEGPKAVIFGAFALAIPKMARRVAQSVDARRLAYTAMAASIYVPLYLTFTDPILGSDKIKYQSPSVEITVVDLFALLLFWSLRHRKGTPSVFPGPLLVPRLLYLGALVMSLAHSHDPLISLYAIWTLCRVYFFFQVLSVGLRELEAMRGTTAGLGLGAAAQGAMALVQRYVGHLDRPSGTCGSSNTLMLALDFVSPLAFSLILAGKAKKTGYAALAACGICGLLGQSRAGSLCMGLGLGIVALGSFLRDASPAKMRILGRIAMGSLVPLALFSRKLIERLTFHGKDISWISRMQSSNAAKRMIAEHAWGVGVNMYGYVANHNGYVRIFNLGDIMRKELVHNYYFLLTAELGYVGLAAYLLVMLALMVTAARASFLRGVRGDIALAMLASLVVATINGWVEESEICRTPMYAFWIAAAITCSLRVPEALPVAWNVQRGVARRDTPRRPLVLAR
jgi:hypothetical protein